MAVTAYSGPTDLSPSLSPMPSGARVCSWYLQLHFRITTAIKSHVSSFTCAYQVLWHSWDQQIWGPEIIFPWAGWEKSAVSATHGAKHHHESPRSVQSQRHKKLPILQQQPSLFDKRNIPPRPGNWVKCDGDEQEIGHNLCEIYEMWLGSRIRPHLLALWRVWLLPSQSPIADTINRVNERDNWILPHLLVDDATWKGSVTWITKGTVGSGNLGCFVKGKRL